MSTAVDPAVVGAGRADGVLTPWEIERLLDDGLARWELDGKRVVCLVPDGTRTAPMALLYAALRERLTGVVASLDWLIALGTHQPMTPDAIARHLGLPSADPQTLAAHRVHNHAWADPSTFISLGEISAEEMRDLSDGQMSTAVPVRVNRLLLECDVAIVVGPVFPHEVVGFSGGNKYFFPGVSAPELIDASHWLGALITASEMIGARGVTPVRKLIDRAAALVPAERRCAAMVVRTRDAGLHGLYLGSCEEAWAAAAHLSAAVHITTVPHPYDTVVSVVPSMYADLWTAGKGVYKLEPVVRDGGELILFAPHVRSFSETHGKAIARAGYHCRDFFLTHAADLADVPLGVLAHGAHVRGLGTYDAARDVENCRITVTLATGIPRAECESVGLAWRDHRSIDLAAWADREGVFVVPRAGEILHRLADRPQIADPTV
ncbi:lactate racemase domain-containing protein [Gaiella sp.]|uniref:lactate racemase domain-containing protein n=1 Tax=Gaiella sp. TaxID=2663207 RepID=UPI003267B920